ncbi:MAG: ABC transporter ATP-binding protein [Actinomycetia bacterium]|nr:ABC transporter ATP-binding protein [Actinomycetes bacterium]MCP4223959.1 ABC transporter ATP-binding protein [Actinomycetes bacterium]MCP5031647.1 ABC transporter ATP-binding protein [Actinomycetes bacterium]
MGQPEPSDETILEVRNLTTEFATPAGPLTAVDDVSFSLRRGKALGLVGESGSGKSVTARSVMRLLPKTNVLTSGEVTINGIDMMGLSARELRDIWGPEVAMVFQDPLGSLNPVMKIGQQVAEGLRVHHNASKREARASALSLLHSVGIPSPETRIDEYPHQLSGGMRQRVVIAIALACGPKLLIADEPTTALDVTVQAQILDLLQDQQRERFMPLVLITHDLGVVAGRTDEVIVMYAGRIMERASTSILFRDMKMPYTEALFRSIPKVEYPSHTRLAIIPGRPPNMVDPPVGCKFAARCRYAQVRCFEEEPELTPAVDQDHVYRCFYPVGSPEGTEALESNIASGRLNPEGELVGLS